MEQIKRYLKNIRTDYNLDSLEISTADKDPVIQFAAWIQQAIDNGNEEANAMNLATVSADGKPSSRIVLLRNFDHSGFVFFSNYHSRKGRDIESNRYAALNFFWPELHRQVRIEGSVSKIEDWDSDDYFNSRPRESQIGAWASKQSESLKNRAELDKIVENLTAEYEGKSIPRPLHWGGYRLQPEHYEFWQGRPNRLHDRLQYFKSNDNDWEIRRLFP